MKMEKWKTSRGRVEVDIARRQDPRVVQLKGILRDYAAFVRYLSLRCAVGGVRCIVTNRDSVGCLGISCSRTAHSRQGTTSHTRVL